MAALVDHSLVVIADVDCTAEHVESLKRVRLRDVRGGGGLPLMHPTRNDRGDRSLFTQGEMLLSGDVHPSVCRALGAVDADGAVVRRCPVLEATPDALNALNGVLARPAGDPRGTSEFTSRTGIDLLLGREALERLRASGAPLPDDGVTLIVRSLRVIPLRSQLGLVLLELSIRDPERATSQTLVEAVTQLAPSDRSDRIAFASIAPSPSRPRFSLGDLLQAVLSPAGIAFEPWSRLFTYCFALINDATPGDSPPVEAVERASGGTDPEPSLAEEMSELAWRLSRHYHPGYRVPPASVTGEVYRPFRNVAHAVQLEGASMVAFGDATFLASGGLRDRFDSAYLPLLLLAYHEHVGLIELAQRASAISTTRERLDDPTPLQEIVDQFLRFRLGFRLPIASDITMHNNVYALSRSAFGLDELQRKATQDVAELASHVRGLQMTSEAARAHERERAYHRRERRRAPLLGLITGMLAFLTASAAGKELKYVITGAWEVKLSFSIAVLLGAMAGVLAWQRQRDEHREDGSHSPSSGHGHRGGRVGHDVEHELVHEGTLTMYKLGSGSLLVPVQRAAAEGTPAAGSAVTH